MITAIIRWSINNRLFILLAAALLTIAGIWAVKNTPVDAIPDVSDVQVIVKTHFPGQAPQVVEDQVTYPLTTALMSVPGAVNVRGYSFFGDSYVYVIFNDKTDLYWARSRVLEYLNQMSAQLPKNATPQLGPDATGVGWVYLYALVDKTGKHDLSQLKSLQDWFLKYELQSVDGVSEVSSLGGMVKQYQIIVDPEKLRAYSIPLSVIQTAIKQSNQEVGASVIEMAEAEYMVTASGYIKNKDDLAKIPLGQNNNGTPLLLKDVADIRIGPQMRRGIAELDGKGEVVGGIVIMRSGENALTTIEGVKEKLSILKQSLPEGVEIITVYDRSGLINRAVDNLWQKLLEELLMVALVCMLFLFHIRSSLVAVISLPIAMLIAFIIMHMQGINANIMSLGGMAIAIGAMIDGAIVLIENMHKHIEQKGINAKNRWQLVAEAAAEVGPALFFGLLIITVSFIPVFTLQAQEGKMFSPLAFTKTYAMAASAVLAITLVPVLMGYFIRGRILPENKNPINKFLVTSYLPVLKKTLQYPKATIVIAILIALSSLWPWQQIGSEFMPPLDEGDLMYMPSTYPGPSIAQARQILQQTDKLISTVPEVKHVFGKIGRAETATDPAPLNMIETYIQLKDRSQWRKGLTLDDLKKELDSLVKFPGLTNAWVMPIKTRIEMLSTGIKTPIGIKIAGPDMSVIEKIGKHLEALLTKLPETTSVYAERVAGGRFIKIDIDRVRSARFGLSIAEVQQVISTAIGGTNLTQSVEGRERYPVNMRYPQDYRNSPEALATLPIVTAQGENIQLSDVASIYIEDGPPMIKSENARINGWVFVDIESKNAGDYVKNANQLIQQELQLPTGYSLTWSGQYKNMERAKARLGIMVPLTLLIIALLLYINFRNITQVFILMGSLPFAIVGSVWFLYWMDFNFSIAVGVGLIALAGVAIETGVIMLVYLDQAWQKMLNDKERLPSSDKAEPLQAILDGAGLRIRPVVMTACATIISLIPILLGHGTGSEVMRRLAAPMVGGMLSSVFLTLLVLPAVYWLWRKRQL